MEKREFVKNVATKRNKSLKNIWTRKKKLRVNEKYHLRWLSNFKKKNSKADIIYIINDILHYNIIYYTIIWIYWIFHFD